MKPTSVIFLIVALLLVIGGFVTMTVAENMDSPVPIVDKKPDEGDKVESYDYTEGNVSSIALNLSDADVIIKGGQPKAEIRVYNFAGGMYEYSSSGSTVNVRDNADLFSLTGFISKLGSFRGLRSYVGYMNLSSLARRVEIDICDANPIKKIDCKIKNGNVIIENNSTATDYMISIEAGDVIAVGVKTDSVLDLTIKNGDARLENCSMQKLNLSIEKGLADISGKASGIDANITNGDFVYDFRGDIDAVNLEFYTNVGDILINGEKRGGRLVSPVEGATQRAEISIGTGDIIITSAVLN